MRKDIQELLKDKKKMKEQGLFTVDTEKVLEEVLQLGFEVLYFFYSEQGEPILNKFGRQLNEKAEKVKPGYIDRFASVKTHRGFVAVIKAREQEIANIEGKKALVLLDNIQDPSNMGAVLRSGIAFGFTDYIFLNCAYAYNEKTIRASAGTVFLTGFTEATETTLKKLKENFKFIVTDVASGEPVESAKKKAGDKFVLVLGNEGQGVSPEIAKLADINVKINYPNKSVESLNVAAAAAILFYGLSKG